MRNFPLVPNQEPQTAAEIIANAEQVLGERTEVVKVKNGYRAIKRDLKTNDILASSRVCSTEEEALSNLF